MTDSSLQESPLRRNWTWSSIQLVLQVLFAVWFRYRGRNFQQLSDEQGALLIVNHQSFLDPLLVGLPLRRPVSFLARDSLFRVPVIGWILRNTYVLPINRDQAGAGSIRVLSDRLKAGYLCGIFPEGTRSEDGQVGEIKPGFIALARRAQCPIYPIGIAGAGRAFGRHHWFPRPRPVCVVYGHPLQPDELAPYLERGREDDLLQLIRVRLVATQAEAQEWLDGGREMKAMPLSVGAEKIPPEQSAG